AFTRPSAGFVSPLTSTGDPATDFSHEAYRRARSGARAGEACRRGGLEQLQLALRELLADLRVAVAPQGEHRLQREGREAAGFTRSERGRHRARPRRALPAAPLQGPGPEGDRGRDPQLDRQEQGWLDLIRAPAGAG